LIRFYIILFFLRPGARSKAKKRKEIRVDKEWCLRVYRIARDHESQIILGLNFFRQKKEIFPVV
jgi:hypothetical protein